MLKSSSSKNKHVDPDTPGSRGESPRREIIITKSPSSSSKKSKKSPPKSPSVVSERDRLARYQSIDNSPIPNREQKILALFLGLSVDGIFRLLICEGEKEVFVNLVLFEAHIPDINSPNELESKAGKHVYTQLMSLVHMFIGEIVEVILVDKIHHGFYVGGLYLGGQRVSLNETLRVGKLAKKIKTPWSEQQLADIPYIL